MKIGLVFSNDWELFGDGSGDYFSLQDKPMREMLAIAQDYGAKVSIMAETAQQLKMKEFTDNDEKLSQQTLAWEDLVKCAVKKGNDVQLHLHPQWFESEFIDSRWQLNMNKLSLAEFEQAVYVDWISKSKKYLEYLLKSEKPDYNCSIFRAGAYYIEPSAMLIPFLLDAGLEADSSVTKGISAENRYDYKDAFSNIIAWNADYSTVKHKGNSPLIEMPIYSLAGYESEVLKKFLPNLYWYLKCGKVPNNDELNWSKKRDEIKEKLYPRNKRFYKANQKKNLRWFLSKFIDKKYLQLDYDYIPASVFAYLVLDLLESKKVREQFANFDILPIISSGHIKDAWNNDNFKSILQILEKKGKNKIEFITISEALNIWKSKI